MDINACPWERMAGGMNNGIRRALLMNIQSKLFSYRSRAMLPSFVDIQKSKKS